VIINAGVKHGTTAQLAEPWAMTPGCHAAAHSWAAQHRTGFRVGESNALKRVTFFFPALRTLLLSLLQSSDKPHAATLSAVQRPILVDIGAGGYGPPEYSDGSDAILLLKRLTGVPCAIHGFELQPNMAAALEKEAATLLADPERAGSSFFVHVLGVGAAPASLRAAPMSDSKPKGRTVMLTPPGPIKHASREHATRARLSRVVNVTSLDVWAARFDRPLLYVKVDTNGHEPAVLSGMRRLLAGSPPMYLSFEYSTGWSEQLTALLSLVHIRGNNASTGLRPRDMHPSLRGFVATLNAAGYRVYLLHSQGLLPVHGAWWDNEFELLLSDSIHGTYDVFAARRGMPCRALETLFFHAPLPCLPSSAVTAKGVGLPGYDRCEIGKAAVATQLRPACGTSDLNA